MGKLMNIKDTSERLGVSIYTLKGWMERKYLPFHKVGDATFFDEDTINTLQDTAKDVERYTRKLTEVDDYIRTLYNQRSQNVWETKYGNRVMNLCWVSAKKKMFFSNQCRMLRSLGVLNERECEVLVRVIHDEPYEEIGEDHGLTRERIRQIAEKAIRRSTVLDGVVEKLEKAESLIKENLILKQKVAALSAALEEKSGQDEKEVCDDALCRLLVSSPSEFKFSVRALNALASNGVVTIGDLARLNRSQVMRFRNIGRKTVSEYEDFLLSHNLTFGMDVDSLFSANKS